MGFFDKVKNLFTDDVEDEPIKSEVIKVEIPAPVKKEEIISDNENIQKEEKKATPIFFDDAYFKELEQPKQEVKSSYLKEQVKTKEERKIFKPTPIISPVYGVLDKNYNKEDIKPKRTQKDYDTSFSVTIDEVRKKAFGTLEDDLEKTLFGRNSILFNEEENKEEDFFDELLDEDIVNIVEDEMKDINIVEEEMDNGHLKESELFDLIDSMYEKGENND